MSHLKEREFVIREWEREIMKVTEGELMFLIDISVEEDYLCIKKMEEKRKGSAKQYLMSMLEDIYIHDVHKDERVKRLCSIAKGLYIKISDISDEDTFYVIEEICSSRSFINKFGVLDSFWRDNEITQVDDLVIQNVCRARHLAYLQAAI